MKEKPMTEKPNDPPVPEKRTRKAKKNPLRLMVVTEFLDPDGRSITAEQRVELRKKLGELSGAEYTRLADALAVLSPVVFKAQQGPAEELYEVAPMRKWLKEQLNTPEGEAAFSGKVVVIYRETEKRFPYVGITTTRDTSI